MKNKILPLEKANLYIEENKDKTDKTYLGSYHLCAQVGWLNDPNGFIFFGGKYHLFYQYHPYSAQWGPMHWGHAVSEDLVKWEYLPVALAPEKSYDKKGCWSGSALAVGERLYIMYTGISRFGFKTQNLAYSDDGINFIKYENNPVITGKSFSDKKTLRDPYLWEKDGLYYCLLADKGGAKLYKSPNLTSWEYVNKAATVGENDFECPCFMNIFGQGALFGSPVGYPKKGDEFCNRSSNVYSVGSFNYERGIFSGSDFREIDRGTDFYAAQCTCGEKGEAVMAAWMNMWERKNITDELSHRWSGMMTLPRTLEIRDGVLLQKPISAIYSYFKNRAEVCESFSGEKEFPGVRGRNISLKISCNLQNASLFTVKLLADERGFGEITYDKKEGKLIFNTSNTLYKTQEKGIRKADCKPNDNTLEMEIFLDNSCAEVFIGDGEITGSMLIFNAPTAERVIFFADDEVKIALEKNDIIL